jgi:hypothetical protein
VQVHRKSSETNAEGVTFEQWEVVGDPTSELSFEKQTHPNGRTFQIFKNKTQVQCDLFLSDLYD